MTKFFLINITLRLIFQTTLEWIRKANTNFNAVSVKINLGEVLVISETTETNILNYCFVLKKLIKIK